MSSALRKYVHRANNRWVVQKHIDGKLKSFKSFRTLNEALTYRDQLIQNNWQIPEHEIEAQKQKEYYKHIHLNRLKRSYKIISKHKSQYLGTVKTIEEALYYRDLYSDCPLPVPKPQDIDLTTDNPYLIDGLRYPLPERLQKQDTYTDNYGKGSIQKRSRTSYRITYNKTNFATCRTYEQAYYVRQELQKCDWDKTQVPRILADYPKWYTWLMEFYRYIIRTQYNDGYTINYPREYTVDNKIERVSYSNLEDALFERDFLVKNGWDYEALVYNIDDSENPYYDMELPPYPERKIRNISERNTYTTELNTMQDLINDGVYRQEDVAKLMDTSSVNIRNWLKKYNTNWTDFVDLVMSGEDIWSVLELEEQYYTPDLSPSKPSNYTGYVHRTQSKRSPYCVAYKGEYYGAYKDKKTAKKIVSELKKVNWDKSKLKQIQERVGYEPFLNTKRWVYPVNKGKSWMIRKKDKTRRMINYGCYKDKRVAEYVRDLLIENNWDKNRLDEFKRIAEKEVNL
jgi:hypothetical protein